MDEGPIPSQYWCLIRKLLAQQPTHARTEHMEDAKYVRPEVTLFSLPFSFIVRVLPNIYSITKEVKLRNKLVRASDMYQSKLCVKVGPKSSQ